MTKSKKPLKKTDPAEKGASGGRLRLHVYIARAGIASRREAEKLMHLGDVTVNGKVITEPGSTVLPGKDHVKVNGRLIAGPHRLEYYAYHKPTGCVSTMKDTRGRFCIGDVVQTLGSPVVPVGRLDLNSSGLLLLTNDGELAVRLMHPSYEIEKVYRVKVNPPPKQRQLDRLLNGVSLSDGMARAERIRRVGRGETKVWLEVTVAEGRKHVVRRMMEEVGLRVDKLKRVVMGPLKLGRQVIDSVRRLEHKEIKALRAAADLD